MSEELIRQIDNLERRIDGLVKPEVGNWITFSPTVTQGVAVNATVTFARYIALSDAVVMEARLAITSAGTSGSSIVIGGFPAAILPANGTSTEHIVGTAIVRNEGTAWYVGVLYYWASNTFSIMAHNGTAFVGADPSFALANADVIGFQGSYER